MRAQSCHRGAVRRDPPVGAERTELREQLTGLRDRAGRRHVEPPQCRKVGKPRGHEVEHQRREIGVEHLCPRERQQP